MPRSFGKTFVGDTQSAALMQPFVVAPSPHTEGVLAAKEISFGFPIVFDPYFAKAGGVSHSGEYVEGKTFSMNYNISGQIDQGKSAFMKAMGRRLSMLQAVDDHESLEPVEHRQLVHDRKMNEYAKYTESMKCQPIIMGGKTKFNPFDPKLCVNEVHMVDIGVNLCEVIKHSPLDIDELTVTAIGIYHMIKDQTRRPCVERLETIMMNLRIEQGFDYYRSASLVLDGYTDDSVMDTMADRMKQLAKERRIGNIDWIDLERAAGRVASYLGQVTRGVLGAIFGGDSSMYDSLTGRCSTIVWGDTALIAQDSAESIMAKWRTIARHNKELIKMVPHLIISDEAGKALARSPIHLRFVSEDRRDARALHTASLTATQYEGDITSAGGNDPTLNNMAEAINNATAGRIIFKLPDTDTNMNALARYGFGEFDAKRVTMLPARHAAFKMPDRPPVFGRVILANSELSSTYSNRESDKMVQGRRFRYDDPEIARRAQLMGVNFNNVEREDVSQ